MLVASSHLYNQEQLKKSRSWEKFTWECFTKHGHAKHSSLAMTLPYIINRCHQEGIAFRLTYQPGGGGYYIERIVAIKDGPNPDYVAVK